MGSNRSMTKIEIKQKNGNQCYPSWPNKEIFIRLFHRWDIGMVN